MKKLFCITFIITNAYSLFVLADRFPLSQYDALPKCSQAICFGQDGGASFRHYCDANGYLDGVGNNTSDQSQFLAMPLSSPSCHGYCPCTWQYVNGARH